MPYIDFKIIILNGKIVVSSYLPNVVMIGVLCSCWGIQL